jgi:acetylornithine deacetylase
MANIYEIIDMLKGMIVRPSFSREEAEVADFLQSVWTKAGYPVRRSGNNLWLQTDIDATRPTLLLNSHIDTVRPVSGWTREPFTADESDDGRLYGLGSNDAGASVVSLYAAYTSLAARKQAYNLIFLASAEEEVSGSNGIESVLPKLPTIDFGIVGEPTGMNPAVAEKGLMVLDCVTVGKAGHAARNEGINAIYLATEAIERLRRMTFAKRSPLLGDVQLNVTQLQAGTQHNVIPDRCSFVVDVRSNEFYTNEELLALIRSAADCEVTARSLRLNSSHTEQEHPVVQRALMLGREPFGSPTLSDQALLPFPTLKIGPGDSARSHTADEYVCVSEIREAVDMYIMLLDGLKI